MHTQNKTQITAFVRCTIPGNGVDLDEVYATSGVVLSPAATLCYYLVDLGVSVPAAQFTVDAIVSNK
jgi:hypothetical protein